MPEMNSMNIGNGAADISSYVPEMRRIKCIHFIGIGGSGMCGIAEVLMTQGYQITGSDIQDGVVTKRLSELGAKVFIGHDETNVERADVVVVSSAIDEQNPEIKAARSKRTPIVPRAEMLADGNQWRCHSRHHRWRIEYR